MRIKSCDLRTRENIKVQTMFLLKIHNSLYVIDIPHTISEYHISQNILFY